MALIKTIIIDDEEQAREGVRTLLEGDSEIQICAICKDGIESIEQINEHSPDLIFLDIQMPEINGFEVINNIRMNPLPTIIFVTAYDQYAISAFEIQALDYLLKPFTNARFNEVLERAKSHIKNKTLVNLNNQIAKLLKGIGDSASDSTNQIINEVNNTRPAFNRLVIKASGKIHFVNFSDIYWIEADDYYVKIHTVNHTFMVRESLKGLGQRLDSTIFLRIHNSSIINTRHLKELEPYYNGEFFAHLTNGVKVKVSRGYRNNINSLIDSSNN